MLYAKQSTNREKTMPRVISLVTFIVFLRELKHFLSSWGKSINNLELSVWMMLFGTWELILKYEV